LYGKPVFVVLDEPNSSLDDAGDAALANAIATLKQIGTTFVVMTHRTSVLGVADKMLIMRDGAQVIFVEVKQSRTHAQAAEHLSARQVARLYAAAAEFVENEPMGQLTEVRLDAALVDGAGQIEILQNFAA
jgi:ABC-type protease/lipase transport system fused ATPase/permease subunit